MNSIITFVFSADTNVSPWWFHLLLWILSHIPLAGKVIQVQALSSGQAFVFQHGMNS